MSKRYQQNRRPERSGGHRPPQPAQRETFDRPAGPPPPEGAPAVYLKSASYRSFIYERMIDRTANNPVDGELAAVVDKRGQLFGWGFYNSRSKIALRMLTHGPERPDESLIPRRIAEAVSLRRDLLELDKTTDAYRLIHAEGDGLSGLIADRFAQYIVIELFSLAMYRRLHEIEDAMIDAGLSVEDFVVRADKHIARQEGFDADQLRSARNASTVITENGVKFAINVGRGHKTGFFCDQRDNRLSLSRLTAGRSMLDVCCYTGGFACYGAAIGNARQVTAVDLDEKALEVAAENLKLNDIESRVELRHADAFDFLRQAQAEGQQWDVVVVDPSKFVPKRDMMDLGLRKYADLNRLAAGVVAPGGVLLTCSCSGLVSMEEFRRTVGRAARSANRQMQIIATGGAAADHPVMADAPESEYLKAIWARML